MVTALAMRKRVVARYCGVWEDSSTMMNRVTKGVMRLAAGGRNVMLATGVSAGQPAPGMFWSPASVISRSEIEEFRPNLDRGLSSPPRLVCIGRLSEEKGGLDVIRAMGLLIHRKLLPESKLPQLTFIGEGPLRRDLEALVKELHLESLVHFRGQLSRAELVRELPSHDILLMPSHSESVGKARLDGMLGGLPAISTAVGSGEALVGSDGIRGWLVPRANPGALADTIARVLQSNIDWPAIRHRCRTFVEQFTLERWTREIAEACSRQWGVPVPTAGAIPLESIPHLSK
jgi:glycosyltransferase involved in cell wall biosynthesis